MSQGIFQLNDRFEAAAKYLKTNMGNKQKYAIGLGSRISQMLNNIIMAMKCQFSIVYYRRLVR